MCLLAQTDISPVRRLRQEHGISFIFHCHDTCPSTVHQAVIQLLPSPLLVPSPLLAPSPLLVA